jgi:hypothetical protein
LNWCRFKAPHVECTKIQTFGARITFMKLVRKANWIAGVGIAAALALTPALGLAQTTQIYTPPSVTTSRTTTTVRSVPVVNPNDPAQFPPANVGMAPDSHEGKVKAAYVDQQIALAKARGQDTSVAETQEIIGQSDLQRGLNTEADQHLDNALRALGIMPNHPQQSLGETDEPHAPMP